jgi:predicted ribosome quality control (RQC) complex YloA/Tae2 family protein
MSPESPVTVSPVTVSPVTVSLGTESLGTVSLLTASLQAMDLTTLRAVLAELRPLLLPSRFEKAQQSDGQTLQLGFRSLAGRHWLELSWQAEAPRLLAIAPPPRGGDGSTLAQQVQHGLSGLALVGLHQEGMERVVELQFATRPGDPISRRLVLELMGRHSNLFVLDGQGRVTGAGRQVREQQSRLRPIGSGDAYLPPPPARGQPPRAGESYADWRRRLSLVPVALGRALSEAYQGISPALALQLAGDQPQLAAELLTRPVDQLAELEWQQLHRRWQRWLAVLASEAFALSPGLATAYRCWQEAPDAAAAAQQQDPAGIQPWAATPPLNESPAIQSQVSQPRAPQTLEINSFLEGYYRQLLDGRRLQQRSSTLRLRLQQALTKEQAQCRQQQERLDQVEGSGALQGQADGLLCLPDPSRDQVAEAQALYRRARKLRRSVAAITPRIGAHLQRIEQLEASLTYLDQLLLAEEGSSALAPSQATGQAPGLGSGPLLAQLEELELDSQSLLAPRLGNRRQRRSGSAPPASGQVQPLELELASGLRVQVGRNHRQNAWISLQQARRGDLWFHAQECPGSHVVLKTSVAPGGEGDLQAAADLAAHFSRARGNRRVAVVMVATDQLQRIPGAGPGTVRHRGGEVLWADPQRAASLLIALAERAERPTPSESTPKAPPAQATQTQANPIQAAALPQAGGLPSLGPAPKP